MLRTLVGFEDRINLIHAALGIGGESGEIVDIIKKHYVTGVLINRDHLIEEMGDLRWYLELMCHCLGITLEEAEQANVAKLRKRHPNGFCR